MSKVDHPAHYGGQDNPYEVIKVLKHWLTPTEFVGFCKGNMMKYTARANEKAGLEDHDKATWYAKALTSFIRERRDAGEPDGLPVAPLFWADLYPVPCEDEEEVIACVELGCVFMLCSTVEPHVQWIVRLDGGDDGDVTERFDVKAKADKWLADRLEEGKRYREQGTRDAIAACRRGDTVTAAAIADEFGLSWSHMAGDGFILIEGVRAEIGGELVDSGKKPRWTPGDGT